MTRKTETVNATQVASAPRFLELSRSGLTVNLDNVLYVKRQKHADGNVYALEFYLVGNGKLPITDLHDIAEFMRSAL